MSHPLMLPECAPRPVLAMKLAAIVLCGVLLSRAEAPADPVALLKRKDAELQTLLRDKDANKKTDRIKVLINGIFDFAELGKKALGPTTWAKMNPNQQTRFAAAFKTMVENASVKKLEAYKYDSTRYEPAQQKGDNVQVTVHAWSGGQESVMIYKMMRKDTTWKAWDLVIDDLSTARNYGEQFRKILQTSDIEGLVTKVERKAKVAGDSKSTDSVKARSTAVKTPVKTVSTKRDNTIIDSVASRSPLIVDTAKIKPANNAAGKKTPATSSSAGK